MGKSDYLLNRWVDGIEKEAKFMKFKVTAVIIGERKIDHTVTAPSQEDAREWLNKQYCDKLSSMCDIEITQVQ